MAAQRDRYLTCDTCGVSFAWTAGASKGSTEPPTRCPACRLLMPAPGRQRGVVKFYVPSKGWGFITPIQGAEIFFHRSGLHVQWSPREGDLVEYTVQQTERGPQAVQVDLLEAAKA